VPRLEKLIAENKFKIADSVDSEELYYNLFDTRLAVAALDIRFSFLLLEINI